MSRDFTNPHRGRNAGSAPGASHAQEVDEKGPDLDAVVHHNARAICDALGVPCGCQASLHDGTCIDGASPCRYALEDAKGSRASGRPAAAATVAEAAPPQKAKNSKPK
ncbi:hypothetical protein LCGC14_1898520 [marine sediment metagenome]|uniref:Uncharacterized protein n=1 Tax=marine sediment metagenome TaxID=412755 RepID=A0A0F9FXJ2_9ZZZZ